MIDKIALKMLPLMPKGLVGRVAARYIAGNTQEQAIQVARNLQARGFTSTLHLLGEDTTTPEASTAAAHGFLTLMRAMEEAGVERNVSVKLSQFGLRIGEEIAERELRRVLDDAAARDFFVRIDMEDSSVTDATWNIYRRAREVWPKVGAVIQARLLRTPEDAKRLAAESANLRLCKGIYPERADNALQKPDAIREAYFETLITLMEGGCYVGIATHDVPLIERIEAEFTTRGWPKERCEFQALLGVPFKTTQERLRDSGFKLRLYVPYGEDWYAYSRRRLVESPQMAGAIAKSFFKRDRLDASAT